MTIFFFFLICFLSGFALVNKLKLEFSSSNILLLSIVLGTTLVTLLLFLIAWVIPMTSVGLIVELSFIGGISLLSFGFLNLGKFISSLYVQFKHWSIRNKLAGLLLFTLVTWLFGRSLFYDAEGQMWAGDRLVWTDWPLHIAMASNFAWGQNVPPQNPTFTGIPLIYPFFADFLSGVLMSLGGSIPLAFAVPGIILTLCFFGLFIKFGTVLFTERKAYDGVKSPIQVAIGALFISLFWGGLGWVYWLLEAFSSKSGVAYALLNVPREYTFWGEKGLWFFTFLYSEILPQRAFLFGLPLFFATLLLIQRGWQENLKKHLIVAGISAGLMPFFHTHSFLALWFMSVSFVGVGVLYVLFRRIKVTQEKTKAKFQLVLAFFVPFAVLTLIQLSQFLGKTSAIRFQVGWMKESENFFWFWFKNTGFFIPLWWWGFFKGSFNKFTKIVGLASWSLFILPNLFLLAPWGYDNLKIFTFWYLVGSYFVMAGLNSLWNLRSWRFIGRVGAMLLFISLTLSGLVEVSRIAETSQVKILLWSKDDSELADSIKLNTPPDSVFLTAAIHDHPVASLAGRKIVIGYPGNSWSWGIEGWDVRESDVRTMFQGGTDALHLWKKYGINYIVVGDRERWFEKELDEYFINQHSQLFIEHANTKVYMLN